MNERSYLKSDGVRTRLMPVSHLTEFGVWWRHCVAGGMSAAVSKTVTAPLDRVRIHMQITNDGGFWSAGKCVYACQGIRGFWRGNGLNVLKSTPEFAIKFSVYEVLKRRLMAFDENGRLNNYERFAAGAVAGVCGQTPMYPIDTIKTRLTVSKCKDVAEVIATTYKSGGLLAFFKGFWLSTLSIFLFTGIDLMTYENIKHWHSRNRDDQDDRVPDSSWSVKMISSLYSCALGVTLCYPIATLTIRAQVSDVISGVVTAEKLKLNFRGLYRGYLGSFVKMLPTMSISYVVYEELCQKMGIHMS